MTSFEQILLHEVAGLPESRRADVLAFVRYLRLSLMDDAELEKHYDAVVSSIRETAARYHITEADIEAEIRAAREERASRTTLALDGGERYASMNPGHGSADVPTARGKRR